MSEGSLPAARRRSAVLDWLAKGPFAIAAAALQGGMNYFIVLFLSFGAGLAATGEYRTLFSYYSLFALVALTESNKVFIRAVVDEDRESGTAIVVNRFVFGLAGLAAVLIVRLFWDGLPWQVVAIAAIGAVIYPFDLYVAMLQARRRFQKLFLVESLKYGGALVLFVLLIEGGLSITEAVLGQLLFMGACNLVFFAAFARSTVDWRLVPGRVIRLLRHDGASQSRLYSFSNMFPASLENVDKLLVGAIFGLEFLGVYTLAYSTGRFLYNILKPAMYVYYRRFVDTMPGWPLLRRVSLAFSLVGFATALIFLLAIHFIPQMQKFDSGKWATVILFCGYGIGILHAVYSQAFSLNRESVAQHAFWAHLIATACSLFVLAAALLSREPLALILLALQYPLRDGLSVWLMHRFRIRAIA